MRHIKSTIMTMLAALMALPVSARDFEYQGLTYTVLDENALTCRTKQGDDINPGNIWTGELRIPEKASDGTNEYDVVEIGSHGFLDNTELTAVSLPEGLITIDNGAFYECTELTWLNIPTTVKTIGNSAFYHCSCPSSIDLPEGLTTIGDYAFSGTKLKSVEIPQSIITIGKYAYSECLSLTSVTLPDNLSSIVEGLFWGCSYLSKINFPESLISIGNNAFAQCENFTFTTLPENLTEIGQQAFANTYLAAITLPDKLTVIGEAAFLACHGLYEIDLPSSLVEIGLDAFRDCPMSKITYRAETPISAPLSVFEFTPTPFYDDVYEKATLTMPNANLSSIQATEPWNQFKRIVAKDGYFGSVFPAGTDFEYEGIWYTVENAEDMTVKTKAGLARTIESEEIPGNIVEGNIEIPSIVKIGNLEYTVIGIREYGFSNLKNLITVVLPETVKDIGNYAFCGCENLESISVPKGIEGYGIYAFSGCKKLKSINLPENMGVVVEGLFYECSSLTEIELQETGLIAIGEYAFGYSGLKEIKFPESLLEIGGFAFEYSSLESVEIPQSLNKLGFGAFFHCENMKTLQLPEKMPAVNGNPFQECMNLKEITYYAINPEEYGKYFFDDKNYESAILYMPNASLATVQSTVPWNLFKNIVASDGSVGSVLTAGSDFEYEGIWYTVLDAEANTVKTKDGDWVEATSPMSDLEGPLTIPATVSDGNKEYTVTQLGSASFAGSNVTSVSLPETLENLGEWTFSNCGNLSSVNIPSSVSEIAHGMFAECKNLESIEIPDNIIKINGWAFSGCSKLTSISIPPTQNVIEEHTFQECSSLTEIELPKNLIKIDNGAFNACRSLQAISFPSTITSIGSGAFGSCESLSSIELPESLTFLGRIAFHSCSNLTKLVIPASLEKMEELPFDYCNPHIEITYYAESPIVSLNICNYEAYENGILNTPNATLALVQTTEPWNNFRRINAKDGSVGLVASGDNFEYRGLTYTVLDAEAKTVKTQDRWYVENEETADALITPDFEIPSIVSDGVNDYTVVEIGNSSFFSCSPLTTIKLPTTLKVIGEYAFDTSNLTSIIVPEGVDSIKLAAFRFCDRLESAQLPSTLKYIGEMAFQEDKVLATVNFPEGLVSIGYNAFYVCDALTEVHLPASLVSIGNTAFGADANLTIVEFKEGLKEIGANAFFGTGITSVTLPASLTSIGDKAFSVYSMTDVTYNAEIPIEAPEDLFYSAFSDIYATATLNMPNATLAAVQATTPWNLFKRVMAKDGTIEPGPGEGEDFEYEGIWYTVIDGEAKTVKTKSGYHVSDTDEYIPGTRWEGNLIIPGEVIYKDNTYSVTEIGENGFVRTNITSVSLPNTVTYISYNAFCDCKALETVKFSESLTEIENNAFSGCELLSNVEFPTSLKRIGWLSFIGCFGLTSIEFPESLTSIEGGAFAGCINLKEISLPSSLTDLYESAFHNCYSAMVVNYVAATPLNAAEGVFTEDIYLNGTLNTPNATLAVVQATTPWNKFVRISAKDGSVGFVADGDDFVYQGMTYTVIDSEAKTVKTKENWYQQTEGISADMFTEEFKIPDTVSDGVYDYKVVEIGTHTFDNCEALRYITLPGTLKTISGYAFASCRNLSTITIPDSVATIGNWAFANCEALYTVFIPASISAMGEGVFRECTGLQEAILPEGMTAISVETFHGCTKLVSVNFPTSLTSIGDYAFQNCESLTNVVLPESLISVGAFAFSTCNKLAALTLPESLKEIGEKAFWGCDFTTLTLPASLTSIGSAAFDRNQNIVEVTYNASEPITAPEDIFDTETADIYATATLNTPNATLAAVQATTPWNKFLHITACDGSVGFLPEVGEVFTYEGLQYEILDAENLTCQTKHGTPDFPGNTYEGDLVIPSYAKYKDNEYKVIKIGTWGFYSKPLITSITFPETLIEIESSAFDNCKGLVTVNFPESLTTIGNSAFYNCDKLASVNLPESLTSLGISAFNGCKGISMLKLPDALTVIESGTFQYCNKITTVDLPRDLQVIRGNAFRHCTGLQSIVIPERVDSIESLAFGDCANISLLHLPGSIKSIGSMAFNECNIDSINYTAVNLLEAPANVFDEAVYEAASLSTPNATLASVQATEPWNRFLHILASDGSVGFGPGVGEDFEYEGIIYTVISVENATCRTKAGGGYNEEGLILGNRWEGDLAIPSRVSDGTREYTVVEIGDYSFAESTGITSLELPETITTIGTQAFNFCTGLTSVMLPESVTAIGAMAFSNCRLLSSITLPASLVSFGESCFGSCAKDVTVTYNASEPVTAPESIFEPAYETGTLHTPNATLAAVQATTPWNKFLHITASDGSVEPGPGVGEDFEYEGILYTVLDTEAKLVKTKDGSYDDATDYDIPGNTISGNFVLPSTVKKGSDEYTVVRIGNFGFSNNKNLTSVIIPESVKTIGEHAFSHCSGLSNVTLPEQLTTLESGLFLDCSSLESIDIPTSVTSIRLITFSRCINLKKINIPEGVTSIGDQAFYSCSSLPSITLPASLQAIGKYAFGECSPEIVVNYLAANPIEADENIFSVQTYQNGKLYTPNATIAAVQATAPWNKFLRITASDGSVEPGPGVGEDFEYEGILYTVLDTEAKTVKTKDGSYESATDNDIPGNTISGNFVLPSTVKKGSDEYTVVRIGNFGFSNSKDLTSVIIPESLKTIGQHAFSYCSGLSNVTLPEGLNTLESGLFLDCSSLESIDIPTSVTSIRLITFSRCINLKKINIPEGVTSIGDQAFFQCSSLPSITLPAALQSIGIQAFEECSPEIEVNYLAANLIEADENIFSERTYQNGTLYTPNATLAAVQATSPWNKFLRITASNGTIEPGVGVGEDFEYDGVWYTVISTEAKTCKTKDGHQEGDVYVPGTDYKGDLVIPEKVFNGSSEYTVTEIGRYGFENATGITSVVIPETVTRIPESAFSGCFNLASASIPESVTTIYIYAFYKCAALKDVKLPKGLTKIGYDAFLGCKSLTSIVIPEGVTRIEDQSFGQCSSLREIDIPAGVEEFESAAFSGCASDASITYRAATPVAASDNLFSGAYQNGTLHMPNATLDAVQATSPWNKFLHITASDGSIEPGPAKGQDIVVDGLTFTVIDENEYLLSTKEGAGASEGAWGNFKTGHLVIPETVSYNGHTYTVTTIGNYGFCYNTDLLSVTIPGTVTGFGLESFYGCERLTSLVWQGHTPLSNGVVEGTGNPNILLYVDSVEFAPTRMEHNIVADGKCTNLVLTPGYAFSPLYAFTADHSEITKAFTQETPIDGCAGWETLAIPFRPTDIRANDGRRLVPFNALVDTDTECPFWLYEADAAGEWKTASAILQGVPYLISMPNNDTYDEEFRVNGDVTFSTDEQTYITPETCTPYATTWATGREFRSLWLPLQDEERFNAMGLNVGISDLTDDDGQQLAPGSAFHADIVPLPMEAYVTRIDGRRSMPVVGDKNLVGMMAAEEGLRIAVDFGSIILCSDRNRTVEVFTTDGIAIRKVALKAGETLRIEQLTRGIYIVAGRKVTVR